MIAQIETAIINHIRLASQAPALGYRLACVESYAGELDDDFAQAVRRFPAVWVAFKNSDESKPYGASKYKWAVDCTFAVLTGARNPQDPSAARAGTVREPGVYQISEHVQQMLLMQDFGLAISPMQPMGAQLRINTRLGNEPVAVIVQEWRTRYILQAPIGSDGVAGAINPAENWPIAQPPDWLRANLNYSLNPPSGKTNATDTITLK